MTTEQTWYQVLEDFYGTKLTDEKATRWINWMKDEKMNITGEELKRVLLWVHRRLPGDEKKYPTVSHLISWVRWYRKEAAAAGRRRPGMPDPTIARIRQHMLEAKDHRQRWNIMCSPDRYIDEDMRVPTPQELQQLERWAKVQWPDFSRPTFAAWTPPAGIVKTPQPVRKRPAPPPPEERAKTAAEMDGKTEEVPF